MIRNLDITLLRTFTAVADLRSMTAASQALHLTQGAISQQIARLEGLTGGALFFREPRGLRLTTSGERLLSKAHALLAMNDEICAEINGGTMAGPVRLGLPYDLVDTCLAPALKSFSEAHPQIDLALRCAPSPDLADAVRSDQLDAAVVELPLDAAVGETLAVDRLVWVGAEGGLAHTRRPLPISLVAETCVFRPAVLSKLQEHAFAWRAIFENGGLDATRATVRMDLAVSAWLASTIPPGLEMLDGAAGLPSLPAFAITLLISEKAQGPAIRHLAHHLRGAWDRPRQAA